MSKRIVILAAAVVFLVLFQVAHNHNATMKEIGQGGWQIRYIVMIWKSYAEANDGVFPAMDPRPGHLYFDTEVVHPAYERTIEFRVPADEDEDEEPVADTSPVLLGRLNDKVGFVLEEMDLRESTFYLGYVISGKEQGSAFIDAYRKQAEAGGGFTDDLPTEPGRGSGDTDRFIRLYDDVWEDLGDEVNPEQVYWSPVMIERPNRYGKPGGWVAYMDGHLEWLPYPGRWPMTEEFIGALEAIEADYKKTE